AFSPDSKLLAYWSFDGIYTVLDAANGKEMGKVQDQAGRRGMATAMFGKDGKTLFVHGVGMPIREWDVATGKEIRKLGPTPTKNVAYGGVPFGLTSSRMALSPDGETLALAGLENVIRFVDLTTGKETATSPGHHIALQGAHFLAGGKVLTQGSDGMMLLWDAATGKELPPLKLPPGTMNFIVSADGKHAAVQQNTNRGTVLIDTAAGNEVGKVPQRPNDGLPSMAFSPDGKTLGLRWQQ